MITAKFLHEMKKGVSMATPRDSGNLDNSKRVFKTSADTFAVVFPASSAGYGYALNKGIYLWGALWKRRIRNPHKDWFDIGVRNSVVASIASYNGLRSADKYRTNQPAQKGFYAPTDRQHLTEPERQNYDRMLKVQRDWNSRYMREELSMRKGVAI